MLAIDLLDEPIVQGIIGAALIAVLVSLVVFVRAWRAKWSRTPLWDEQDPPYTYEPPEPPD